MRAVFIENKPKIAFCGVYQLVTPRLSLWGFGVRTFLSTIKYGRLEIQQRSREVQK
jgi:hypothetical protein